MQLSRLFSVTLVVAVATGATIFACGGGGGGAGNPDAKVFHDAKVFNDAPGGSAASGIGKICTGTGSGDPSLCTAPDTSCVTLNGTVFFCTKTCGTGGSAMPPTGGNAACAAGETSSGTPLCALIGSGSGSSYQWDCGVGCGTFMTSNLGTCPSGLTCTSNICQ